MSSPFGRIGLAGGISYSHAHRDLVQRATCNLAAGDLYTFPNSSSTVDATKAVTFTWNTACPLSATSVDLYLYEASGGLIHGWTNVDYTLGSYTANLLPKWWNSTSTANLQLSIIKSGADSWDTTSPPGPIFKVTYPESAMFTTTTANGIVKTATADAAVTNSADAIFQDVSSVNKGKGGISKGAIAAAVVVPIVVLIIVAGLAVRFWRSKEKEKRRRWSQAMSQHSNLEWEKGAMPGDKPASVLGGRPSIGSQHARPSIGSYHPRPTSMAASSVFAVENNMAGAGANGAGMGLPRPSYQAGSQSTDNLRSSLVLPDGQVRQSRISFAETTRPDRRSRLSLGGDLRPTVSNHSGSASLSSTLGLRGLFKLPHASKSASHLETGHVTSGKKASYATGSAIADDEVEDVTAGFSPKQLNGPPRTNRRSILSLGGGADKRRESVASALSADDFKSAASARGSVDELRDIERSVLARRSMMTQSQYSTSARSPAHDNNGDAIEALDNSDDHADYYHQQQHQQAHAGAMGPPPLPSQTQHQTVAYGPDQMLAVYAARGKVNNGASASGPSTASPSAPILAPALGTSTSQSRPSAKRLLSNLTKRNDDASAPAPAPAQTDMKSFVHLNNGTVSSAVVDALPLPGPSAGTAAGLRVPEGKSRLSGASDGSEYSEKDVGSAQ